jgi:hypothetical protein
MYRTVLGRTDDRPHIMRDAKGKEKNGGRKERKKEERNIGPKAT